MSKGCIVLVELPQNSSFGESYHIIVESLTFEEFDQTCKVTGCVPQQNGCLETIYIPLAQIIGYTEVRGQ